MGLRRAIHKARHNWEQLGEAIEETRKLPNHENWRCTMAIRDPRNTARIRVICRNESELQRVKKVTQKPVAPEARILRELVDTSE